MISVQGTVSLKLAIVLVIFEMIGIPLLPAEFRQLINLQHVMERKYVN